VGVVEAEEEEAFEANMKTTRRQRTVLSNERTMMPPTPE